MCERRSKVKEMDLKLGAKPVTKVLAHYWLMWKDKERERWQVHHIWENATKGFINRAKHCKKKNSDKIRAVETTRGQSDRKRDEVWKKEGEEETESSRDGGTHSKSDGLDWHACWPSTLSFLRLLFLSNAQLSFLLPPASAAVQGTQTPVQRKHGHTHTHPHTPRHTHLSKQGGWRDRGGWGLRGPRGLSLEECCLYLKTHISCAAKNKWPPRTLTMAFLPTSWLHFGSFFLSIFSNLIFLTASPPFIFSPSSPSFSRPSSILHHTLCSALHLIYPLHLSGFVAAQHSVSP